MKVVFQYLHGQSPELLTDIFTLHKNPYNICNIRLTLKTHGQWVLEWMQ